MEMAPVPSQACFRNDNQQKSGSDTKNVGVCLEQPTLTHGLLDGAASMVVGPQHLYFTVNKSVKRKTRNVSYKEII